MRWQIQFVYSFMKNDDTIIHSESVVLTDYDHGIRNWKDLHDEMIRFHEGLESAFEDCEVLSCTMSLLTR